MPRAAPTRARAPRTRTTLRPPSIITALDDRALFAPFFRGGSWDGWRTVLKAGYGLPLTEQELDFFRSIAGHRNPPSGRVRELWCVVGRRAAARTQLRA